MDPLLTCPSGYTLEGRYCVLMPTMSCEEGYQLKNNMCYMKSNTEILVPKEASDGNCPIGYVFNSADNICYPL